MSDRLSELLRQRALLREHLAWLDRQIDEEEDKQPAAAAAESVPLRVVRGPSLEAGEPAAAIPAATVPPVIADPTAVELEAESILEQYRTQPVALGTSVKRGCYAYFFLALFFFAGLIAVFYYFVKLRQGR